MSDEQNTGSVMVYRYGLLPPTEGADEVRQQVRLAHRYRNTLVEIERARRAAVHDVLSTQPDVLTAERVFEDADASLLVALRNAATAKSAARSATAPEALRTAVKDARGVRNAALNSLSEARRVAQADPDVAEKLDVIKDRAGALRRGARAICGVFWGTYLLIEDADVASRKMPLYEHGRLNRPRFVRWEGEGRVGVQVQKSKPLSAETVHGTDTRVRIEPGTLPPGADPTSKRSARRRYTTLALRVGSEDDRSPRWARWPMVMHRPLPEGALIKYATVQVRRIGPREEWSVIFTVDLTGAQPNTTCESTTTTPSGRIAIDIGWRVMLDGLRVAAWRDDSGNTGTLLLDHRTIGRFRKAEDLQSIRKSNFNDAQQELRRHLAGGLVAPAWFTDATRYLAQWKSADKLAALCRRWRAARFAGDEVAYDALEAWRYHDFHLWEWETSQRKKALRYRREVYRLWAADIAARYATVVLEDFDLRKVARKPKVEAVEPTNDTARNSRVIASTSELRGVVLNAFKTRGRNVEFVDPAYTTKTCAACGSVEHWNQADELRHRCSACEAEWDQDDNAAVNLLAWCEQPGGAPKPRPARKKQNNNDPAHPGESRWTRAKRMSAEKKLRREAARQRVA